MKRVYLAQNIIEGQIVAGMLEAAGIPAFVGGFYLQGALGDIGCMDTAAIHVSDADYAVARDIIRAYESSGETVGPDSLEP